MRSTVIISSDRVPAVRDALAAALRGQGPALAVVAPDTDTSWVPREVDDDTAVLIETSGSGSAPKRVALSAVALMANARAGLGRLGGAGTWVLALPVHFIGGLQVLVRSLDSETEPILLTRESFNTAALIDALSVRPEHERLYMSVVPVQLGRIVEHVEHDPAALAIVCRLSAILVGGQRTSPSLLTRARALGLPVVTTYGATETAGGCVYDGLPLNDVKIHIRPDGRIEVGGSILATEFIGDSVMTAQRFSEADGVRWYLSDDIGEFREGSLTVQGRNDRVLISGGIKVNLELVEEVTESIRECAYAVAVSLADQEWGERVGLVVELDPEETSADPRSLAELIKAIVRDELGVAATPREVRLVEQLPRLSSGKPDRLVCAALFAG
ncbi:MAG: AMP-binding protein [Aurantimicrobium sp.]|nr:AMP-binding protein [Aurantimicrobium sp.]